MLGEKELELGAWEMKGLQHRQWWMSCLLSMLMPASLHHALKQDEEEVEVD